MNIIAEKISKSFFIDKKVETKALRDVSLEIRSGEIVAVMGPSGAGKSTLLHIIGLMDRQSSGKIIIDGQDSVNFSDKEYAKIRKENIGFLFQMHYLLPDFTVFENVLIPVWEKKKEKIPDVLTILERLSINERLNHLPSELSGGEQQRVALARALINGPRMLLCDEPTGDLDRETGKIVEELIFSESRKRGITLILVTHNPELADKADRIIKMRDGKII
ncbi:MAG: ABC transporter ATP-binding protein [Elusimicrobia bacterium]|nr:ABC transporter ATP-binding protein [Elusimicrobiota bacterium]